MQDTGLTSLRQRRERGDLIEAFKALRGVYKVDKASWFRVANPMATRETRSSVTMEEDGPRRNSDVLYKPPAKHEIRDNFFTVRIVRRWNALPETVKGAKSVNAFKTALDNWTKKNYLSETRGEIP